MIRMLALLLLLSGAAYADPPADSAPVAAARARLLDHLQHIRPDVERFELTLVSHPPKFTGVVGAVHGNVLSPHTCVWIDSVPVWFSVKAYRRVLVSQRNRAARDSVDAGDFAVEERDV